MKIKEEKSDNTQVSKLNSNELIMNRKGDDVERVIGVTFAYKTT